MADPKHKIFFGVVDRAFDPDGGTDKPGETKKPCWTWDVETPVFSSSKLRFDCDYDIGTLISKNENSVSFTWDNDIIKFDSNIQIFN